MHPYVYTSIPDISLSIMIMSTGAWTQLSCACEFTGLVVWYRSFSCDVIAAMLEGKNNTFSLLWEIRSIPWVPEVFEDKSHKAEGKEEKRER